MRLQVQMLLSVASGGLGPAATVVRAFVPAAALSSTSAAVRLHSSRSTASPSTLLRHSTSGSGGATAPAAVAGYSVRPAAISSWGRASLSSSGRRSIARMAEAGPGSAAGSAAAAGAAAPAAPEGGGGGGGGTKGGGGR
ncbi:unnamed protein product, partial [Scytosiphon promiscuus]